MKTRILMAAILMLCGQPAKAQVGIIDGNILWEWCEED